MESAVRIAREYVKQYKKDFEKKRQVEVKFEIPAKQTIISGTIDLILTEDGLGKIADATVVDYKALEGGENPAENRDIDWTELSLQVQLYALAAQKILGKNAKTGFVHLLKDNKRQEVPIDASANEAAIQNVEWVISGVLEGDYPQRASENKCKKCDFCRLCNKNKEGFKKKQNPPKIKIPDKKEKAALAFSELEAI